jgi:hypothetical protein
MSPIGTNRNTEEERVKAGQKAPPILLTTDRHTPPTADILLRIGIVYAPRK